MTSIRHRAAPPLTALAAALVAALAVAACDRGERIPLPPDTAAPTGATAGAPTEQAAPTISGFGTGSAPTAELPPSDSQFVTEASEGGQFEVEVAKLAAEKATDPAVKAFAQMLVDDHTAANVQLRQIATSHSLALPASLPDEKKQQLEQLSKLSGPEFDRKFIELVGLKDHRHDIEAFEKATQSAQSEDVKRFAQATLPTLKKHLAAAEKLPGPSQSKG